MSIQSYLQQVAFDDRVRNVGQALPALTKTGIALECQVDIMVTRGFDKTAKRSSTFTVVGENGDLIGAIQAGSIMASNIENNLRDVAWALCPRFLLLILYIHFIMKGW